MNTKAYSETYEILNLIGNDFKCNIPKSFFDFLESKKDNSYNPKFNPNIPLEEQNLMKETIHILAILKLKYWCNEEEKVKFVKMLNENERKYQEEIHEKYNPDKLFQNSTKTELVKKESSHEIALQETKKENFLTKLIRKIKSIFFKK